jgi:hypothetical protein
VNNQKQGVDLGSILCKTCGDLIDTFDTEKVIIYYSLCDKNVCRKHENVKDDIQKNGGVKRAV